MFIYVNITKIMKIILFSCKNNCFSTKKASNRCQTQKLSYFKIIDINCLYLLSTTKLIQFYFGESKTQNFLLLQIFTSLKKLTLIKIQSCGSIDISFTSCSIILIVSLLIKICFTTIPPNNVKFDNTTSKYFNVAQVK